MNDTSIVTFTGKLFDFKHPTPEMVCIEDIAHSLACTNRYYGHTRVPYSVAEHCVRMSFMTVGDPLVNLLHDAPEAYIDDVCRPQKKDLGWRVLTGGIERFLHYSTREDTILEIIYVGLGLKFQTHPDTKKADNIILATEIRDLMPPHEIYKEWIEGVESLPLAIVPWGWKRAEYEYLRRFEELTK